MFGKHTAAIARGVLHVTLAAVSATIAAGYSQQQDRAEVVARIRQAFPTPMSAAQQGALVYRVAAELGRDYGVLLKPGGNNCPSPVGLISCDIVVHIPSEQEYDILGDAEGAGVPRFDPVSDEHTGEPVKCGTPGKSGCDMARVVRASADIPAPAPPREDPAPQPQPTPSADLSRLLERLTDIEARLAAMEDLQRQLVNVSGTISLDIRNLRLPSHAPIVFPDYTGRVFGSPVTLRPKK